MSDGAEVVFALLLALVALSSCRTCVHVDRVANELHEINARAHSGEKDASTPNPASESGRR